MQLTFLTLLSIASLALAGCPNLAKRDNGHPGDAAGIENAVTSLLSQTRLPPSLSTLGPALSSAGVTGVVVSETTYGAAQPTGTGSDQDGGESNGGGSSSSSGDYESEQGGSGGESSGGDSEDGSYRGLAASSAVPRVLLVGVAGAVGMAVLGVL